MAADTDIFSQREARRELTLDEAEQKRFMYEKMPPRRRKFVDRMGYDNWDPFAAPKEPLDIRRENTGRTAHELVRDFMKSRARQSGRFHRQDSAEPGDREVNADYARGVLECAVSIINKDEKYRGVYDFCVWYSGQIRDEEQPFID